MTSSGRALLRYGLLAAGMLICATLAGLACVRAIPAGLLPQAKTFALCGAALGMLIQGVALFPTKWESRLIVKPHALASGSLILFAGAALIVMLLLTGCSPATAMMRQDPTINFSAANRAELKTYSALGVSSSMPARLLSGERTDEKQAACLRLRPAGKRFCVAVYARSKPRQRVCAGRIKLSPPEQATT